MTQKMKTPGLWAEPTGADGSTAACEHAKNTPSTEAAQCGKRATVQAYCNGWLSLQSCAELFAANPDWGSA